MRPLLTERDILIAIQAGLRVLTLDPSTLITPLARDTARERGVQLTWAAKTEVTCVADLPQHIAIGSDHRGFALKTALGKALSSEGFHIHDAGPCTDAPCDYPIQASVLCRLLQQGIAEAGIMIDGAGIGSSIACSKHQGIRAAHCHDILLARYAREHNHANVLTLGAAFVSEPLALEITLTFLKTAPLPGRHSERVALLDRIESLTLKV